MFAGSSNKLRTVGRAVHTYEGYYDSDVKLVWMSLPMRVWALLGARFGASGEREQVDTEEWLKGQEEDEVIRAAAPRRQGTIWTNVFCWAGLRTSGDGTDVRGATNDDTSHLAVIDEMDPYTLGVFPQEEALPIIRILVDVSYVKVQARQTDTSNAEPLSQVILHHRCPYDSSERQGNQSLFPYISLDVSCRGVSSKTFRAIEPDHDSIYTKMLELILLDNTRDRLIESRYAFKQHNDDVARSNFSGRLLSKFRADLGCASSRANEGFNSILTVAPSELTVVEAAAMLMRRPGFQSCSSLLSIFSNTPSISKGDRGEVVAALILLKAIDNCCFAPNSHTRRRFIAPRGPYKVLLKSTPSEGDRDGTFEEIFKGSNIYFTHFIKVLNRQVLTQEMLLRYIVRGAAVFCADGQQGVDLVVSFIYKGTRMTRTNISILLCQVKNDADYTRTPVRSLFDNMDLTKPSFKTFPDGGTPPIIRMAFALEAGLAESISDEPSNASGHIIIMV
ncbi:hypothetical protein CERSUDRAFT_122385 [Gelatoporia subvermispora B]|uniref:Uncharacterized protein n=1 Tax=Ceriporiopsis subvermispora (strain B) TaxID=914234 RepID=M2RK36_CERS8|nr:hypothetical protein CERSUDRAFT_122385 [Gelatoporia subvermispora B]